MSDKLQRGELITVDLAGLTVQWEATAMLIRVLGEKWGITQGGLEVVLAVAARHGSPEFFRQSKAGNKNAELVLIPNKPAQPRPLALMREQGERLRGAEFVEVRDGVAVLPITGTILPKATFITEVSGLATLDALALDLEKAVVSKDIKAIVLAVDSPGGALAYTNEFSKQVAEAAQLKPVIAHGGSMVASAAFWIASAAQELWIDETTDVGSVGVIMTVTRRSEEDKARRVLFISSVAPNKVNDPDTDAGKAVLQSYVDQLGEIFVEAIASNRGLTPEQVLKAGGGLLIGKQAIKAGFADRIGTLEQAIAHARKLATAGAPLARRVAAHNEELNSYETIQGYAAR